MEKHYRCWAEIDRSALRHNVAFVREKFGLDIDLLAVVKANAYGHGMIEVAQTIADQAKHLRHREPGGGNCVCGRRSRIQSLFSGQPCRESEAQSRERGFIPSISTLEEARDFDRIGRGQKGPYQFQKSIPAWGRMGVLGGRKQLPFSRR